MNRKCNKNQSQKLNLKRQAARCKASNFIEDYDIIIALQSTIISLQEWKVLQREFSLQQKIRTLLINSKVANRFVFFNQRKASFINLSVNRYLKRDADSKQNLISNINNPNISFTPSKEKVKENQQVMLFQAPTLLIGCHSQGQVSFILKSIFSNKFRLSPQPSSMTFPWLQSKVRHLQFNRILLGGLYKNIKYSHLDFFHQNNINFIAYPTFRDSLKKKISLLLNSHFTFFQHKIYQQRQIRGSCYLKEKQVN